MALLRQKMPRPRSASITRTAVFYAGVWAADVNLGLEVDGYLGYGIETDSGFGASLGFTTYQYTGDFDTEYNEGNLELSYDFASVEYSVGTRKGDPGMSDSDYSFTALTLEHKGFYGTYGSWGKDFKGDYVELGYGAEVGGFDLGVSMIFSDENLSSTGKKDENIVFSLSKSFDL